MSQGSASGWKALALVGMLAVVGVAVCSMRDDAPREAGVSASKVSPRHDAAPNQPSSRGLSGPGVVTGVVTAAGGEAIRGQITDAELGPLSEGRLDVYCLDSSYQSTATISEDGEFEVSGCATGPSCLRLTHPSVEQPRAWELESGGAVGLELETEPAARVTGTIRSPAGESVAGADVFVDIDGRHFAGSADAEGEYAVGLPRARPCDRCDLAGDDRACRGDTDGGLASMLISADGFAPLPHEFTAHGEVLLDLVLEHPGLALRGRVLGRDGEPFDERTRVLASNREREQERHAADVDAQGRFAFEELAEDAEYRLRAIRDEREIADLALARPGDRVELRAGVSAHGSTLIVEVVDVEAEPIIGARVDGGPFRAASTDTAGRVEADEVLPGRYTVRVRRADCAAIRETIALEPGGADSGAWVRRVQLPENC